MYRKLSHYCIIFSFYLSSLLFILNFLLLFKKLKYIKKLYKMYNYVKKIIIKFENK